MYSWCVVQSHDDSDQGGAAEAVWPHAGAEGVGHQGQVFHARALRQTQGLPSAAAQARWEVLHSLVAE